MEPITVTICTRNRCESLRSAVSSVLDENPDELLIIDQSDGRDTQELIAGLHDERVRYTHSSVAGLSRAYNLALSTGRHELMAFTDDDCVVPTGWVESIRTVMARNPGAAMIYGQVLAGQTDLPPGTYIPELAFDERTEFSRARKFRVFGMGANFAGRRSQLLAVGGFDEALGGGGIFKSSQDFDMQYRLWRAGYTVVADPTVRVLHFGARTKQEWPVTARAYGFGDGAFYMKHVRFGDAAAYRLLATRVLKEALRPLARVIRRKPYSADYAIGFIQGARASAGHPLSRKTRRYSLGA